jgi:adenylate kinase
MSAGCGSLVDMSHDVQVAAASLGAARGDDSVYVVLLGPPGAGKGTQAAVISQRMGLKHIATGDLFREAVRNDTELGRLAKKYMDKGELVPDEVTIRMLLERIEQPDASQGVIFDGFPRNLVQAQALDDALFSAGKSIDRAVLISVPDEELVARLSTRWLCPNGHIWNHDGGSAGPAACETCGAALYQREDDKPETVRRRVATQKPPDDLVRHYSRQGKLDEVNGQQSPERVSQAIMQALQTVAPSGTQPT